MAGKVPTVMVSSTFFDLREVRHQLAKMIDVELAYRVLISENPSFPVEPDASTIENCRRRVEEDADILILVIGRRYGYVDSQSGKSVTNLEYLAARAKGIPIYTFIEHEALTLFEAWRAASADHKAAFVATVGDARLFEFIERVRSVDSVWMNGFSTSDDIITGLRVQFAYLMTSGLVAQSRIRSHPQRELLKSLSPKAFRLAVDQPRLWEPLLFAQVLQDEVERLHDRRRQYDLSISFGPRTRLSYAEIIDWVSVKIREFRAITVGSHKLLDEPLQEALATPGASNNAVEIAFIARQISALYAALIDWTQEIRRVDVEEEFQDALDCLMLMSSEMIQGIGSWGQYISESIDQKLVELNKQPHHKPQRLDLALTISIPKVCEKITDLIRDVLEKKYRSRIE